MFLEVIITNLVLMVAHKYFRNSEVYSQYDSILFKPNIGNIYRSEFLYYRTDRVYKEQTGTYIVMAKKDGYLYAWKKGAKNNGN